LTVTRPGLGASGHQPQLSLQEITELLDEFLPESGLRVAEISPDYVTVLAAPHGLECRPGGTLSGPAIFKVADLASFLAVNVYAGRVLTGVLTQGSINLLEAVRLGPLTLVISLAKLGLRMAVTNVRVTDADGLLIAVATMQFALPARRAVRPAG
jgi:acyl-coenzyme A thioesterase PaaI-like protein